MKVKVRRKAKPRAERDDPDYLNIADLAKLFGVAQVTIHRHLPKMRTVRFGRRVLVRREDADAYAKGLIREPTQPPKRRRYGADQRAAGAA